MLLTNLLFKTEKNLSSDAVLPSHQLLLKAGLVRQVSAGIYSLTPLAFRVLSNITQITREEMNKVGGQEVLLPVVQPKNLWEESGRYETVDSSLVRFRDRNKQELVLAMTHEEVVTDLVRSFVSSYRQLPLMVYQIQTKFRDEARPRGGLIRLREFMMKDAYSFHADAFSLDEYYNQMLSSYEQVYRRCGMQVKTVESDTGMMGGGTAHEFMVITPSGEDTLLICEHCGYAANREVARRQILIPDSQPPQNRKRISTPNVTSVESLAKFTNGAQASILKCVLYTTSHKQPVLACVLGDQEINEIKLAKALGVSEGDVRVMNQAEAERLSLTVGYVSPIGMNMKEHIIIVDETVVTAANLVAGANERDYHFTGVNYGRDFEATLIADISHVKEGDACPQCRAKLSLVRGIEVGNIFKLGTKYSLPMQANFTNRDGAVMPMVMGCYGIGITRMLATIVEQNHDELGMIWPLGVAPYRFHLIAIGSDDTILNLANQVYEHLGEHSVLFDNRAVSTGVKLADADLLGMPIRITVSERALTRGGVEVQIRRTRETEYVPVEHLEARLKEICSQCS